MALITLGSNKSKISVNTKSTKMTQDEIKIFVKNMSPDTRDKFLDFLIEKVKEEQTKITKAFLVFKESLDSSVICKDANIATIEDIKETYDIIIKILRSDFAGIEDTQIEYLKKERRNIIRDLSLAYCDEFIKNKK